MSENFTFTLASNRAFEIRAKVHADSQSFGLYSMLLQVDHNILRFSKSREGSLVNKETN